MTWGNILGMYLFAGTVFYGFGWIARKAWTESGKMKPIDGKYGRLAICCGTVIGILFWPVVLLALAIGWRMRRRTRKMERLLGYCEHATAWEPYCGSCLRDLKEEEKDERTPLELGAYLEMKTADDEMPEWPADGEMKHIKCSYDCASCGTTYDGMPPGAREDGLPLCTYCKKDHPEAKR